MDFGCIPNMTGLTIEHCIDDAPAGSKTEWIDFSSIDYSDKRDVPNLEKVELSKVATTSFLLLDVARLQTMRGLIDKVLGHRSAVEDEMNKSKALENELLQMPTGVAAAVPPEDETFDHRAMQSQCLPEI